MLSALTVGRAAEESRIALKTEHFDRDPGWEGHNNRVMPKVVKTVQQDFGCRATSFAGNANGELGGAIRRSGIYGYYADRVGPLSLADRLEAGGKVMLAAGPPDSGMYLGWFHSAHKENSPHQAGDFVGVRIGGPTRIGHYFAPAYATALWPVSDRATGPDRRDQPAVDIGSTCRPLLTERSGV